jgi:hypothetical protein
MLFDGLASDTMHPGSAGSTAIGTTSALHRGNATILPTSNRVLAAALLACGDPRRTAAAPQALEDATAAARPAPARSSPLIERTRQKLISVS